MLRTTQSTFGVNACEYFENGSVFGISAEHAVRISIILKHTSNTYHQTNIIELTNSYISTQVIDLYIL